MCLLSTAITKKKQQLDTAIKVPFVTSSLNCWLCGANNVNFTMFINRSIQTVFWWSFLVHFLLCCHLRQSVVVRLCVLFYQTVVLSNGHCQLVIQRRYMCISHITRNNSIKGICARQLRAPYPAIERHNLTEILSAMYWWALLLLRQQLYDYDRSIKWIMWKRCSSLPRSL